MALRYSTMADPAHAEALGRLVEAKGIGQHAPFFVAGEGRTMPNGLEEASGYVIDARGRVFSFWTTWDAERGEPAFRYWDEVQPESDWLEDEDYRDALDQVGLTQ